MTLKISHRKFAMKFSSLCVVFFCGFQSGLVSAQSVDSASGPNDRSVEIARPVKMYAFESRFVPEAFPVLGTLESVTHAKIRAPIVQRLAIDMIDEEVLFGFQEERADSHCLPFAFYLTVRDGVTVRSEEPLKSGYSSEIFGVNNNELGRISDRYSAHFEPLARAMGNGK